MVNYTYGTTGNSAQRLTGISTPTPGISYTYDRYGRVITETRNYGSMQYVFNHTYSRLGRHTRTVYPGDVTVDYCYDLNGFCDQMKVNGERVWYIKDYDYYSNGNDLYVIDSLGSGQNGLARTIRYDEYGNLSTIVMTRQNSNLHAMTFQYDRFTGNLMSRSGMLPNESEIFTYDALDRLIRHQDVGRHWDNIFQYTHDGYIQYRTGLGYYDYQPTSGIRPHAVKRVDNMSGRISTDDNYVTYNELGKASQIVENHAGIRYDIVYGPDGHRWESSLYKTSYQWPDTVRRYVGDMEIVTQGPSEVCRFYYLDHGVILRKVNTTITPLYAFTDNLGSITRLYTENGTEKFKAQYDPWGVQIVSKNDINFARGYCGHEMLNWFQLINMNGRMYDPVLGRFLSPDNYVQMPTSTQSFNRYSYCLNNSMKYVDTTGESWLLPIAIGAMIGAYTGASIHSHTAAFWNWKSDAWKGAITGAYIGASIGGFVSANINSVNLSKNEDKAKSFGFMNSVIDGGTTNIIMNVINNEGNWSNAWKAGLSGSASALWTLTGGGGMVLAFGSKNPIANLAGKLGYQMIGTTMTSMGDNWANNKAIFSRIDLGVGPLNLTLGKGQKLLQWKNNFLNIAFNSIGLGYVLFAKNGNIRFDMSHLSFIYTRKTGSEISDKEKALGIFTITGESELDLPHEALHLWQSRSLGNKFLPNYILSGIRGLFVDNLDDLKFLEIFEGMF